MDLRRSAGTPSRLGRELRGDSGGVWTRALVQGAAAGFVGVTAMTLGEKLEQGLTGRPSSHIPARTFERAMGLPERPGRQPVALNVAVHFGQGTLFGCLRGVMATAGLRGPWASTMFMGLRLTNDQILENATGTGAPPWTWPRGELVVDLIHKAVYAFATGWVADALAARHGPGPGQVHAALPGRRSDAGPPPRFAVR
jgi:hypothetical protein